MRTNWETYPVEFRGGLITNLPILQHGNVAPGSARTLQNFEPSIEGGYKKVLGYNKWNEFEVPGEGVVQGVIATSSSGLIAVRESKYYTSQDKADWEEKLDLSSSAGNKVRHCTFNFDGVDKICMVDGVNKPVFWNSDTGDIEEDTSAPSDVEGAIRVANFKNHLFFSKGSNLVFTAPFNEKDYSAGNGSGVINVGSRIVGLIVFREQLIVFSINRIQRIVGNTSEDFQLQPITMDTGAFCGDTIQEVGGDILYLGPDGVRFLSATERIGDFALNRASENIQSEVTNLFKDCGNYSSVVIRAKSQYRIFRYDEDLRPQNSRGFLATLYSDQSAERIAWSELVGIKAYNSDSKMFRNEEVIVFCNDSGYIYQLEKTFAFDEEPIEAIFKTPYIPIEDPRRRKTYYKHILYLKTSGNFDLRGNLSFDYKDSRVLQPPSFKVEADQTSTFFWGKLDTVWGDFIWGLPLKDIYETNVLGSSFTVSFNYYDNSTNPSYSLDTALLEFKFNDKK